MTGTFTELTAADTARVNAICERVRGWSGPTHYLFFKALFDQQQIQRMLMLGVYHGRDIAFILDVLRTYHPQSNARIVGVDRFTADPCSDWAQTKTPKTWEQEVFAPPPSFENAVANTADPRVEIIKADDFTFLENSPDKFDAVYLDTAHDYGTVRRQLRQVPRVCNPGALLCGDDYSDRGTWGVKSAVSQGFVHHQVVGDWIWFAPLSNLKPQTVTA